MAKRSRTEKTKAAEVDVAALQAALDQAFPDRRWLRVLALFRHTGVADAGQVREVTGLSRDQLDTLLRRFRELAGEEVLARVPFNVPRPGVRGRPPAVYKLGQAGAALLRANGYADAHACGLTDARSIAHARATLDVRLAAQAAGLSVQTERELSYGDGQVLRPDNLVTLPGGTQAIFEVEQAANLTLLRRIVDGLRRKAAFFRSSEGKRVSPTVRVLINLPHGPAWDKTVRVWERATAIVADEHGGHLSFKIVALPLQEFLQAPDWEEPPDPARWESLFDPAQTTVFGLARSGTRTQTAVRKPARRMVSKLPAPLRRRSARNDRLILAAFWQVFQEQAPILGGDHPRPDPAFFDVMRIIYTASNDPHADILTQAALPHASLYLLRKYLEMHPRLRDALSKAVTRGSGSMRWSVSTIFHRMQAVIATFLKYHGWRADGPLLAYPVLTGWGEEGTQTFSVVARIRNPELLMGEDDEVVPGRDEVRQAEEALAWVLWALFAYSEEVGLKRPGFW